jgi:hypothetical protein
MPPPAAPGTRSRIGRSGYSPALALAVPNISVDATQAKIATPRVRAQCLMIVLPDEFFSVGGCFFAARFF